MSKSCSSANDISPVSLDNVEASASSPEASRLDIFNRFSEPLERLKVTAQRIEDKSWEDGVQCLADADEREKSVLLQSVRYSSGPTQKDIERAYRFLKHSDVVFERPSLDIINPRCSTDTIDITRFAT